MRKKLLVSLFLIGISFTFIGCAGLSSNGMLNNGGATEISHGIKVNEDGSVEMTEDQMYKLLEDNGYGEGVDWANKSDDDPNISKEMDITSSKEKMGETYLKKYPDAQEPGDMYEKAWWDYIPDSYDLTKDVFEPTEYYAGQEKMYNNSLQQGVFGEDGLTSGQSMDLSNAKTVATSFIYADVKDKYKWTADLEKATEIAKGFDVADFYVMQANRPMYHNAAENWLAPDSMWAKFNQRIEGYDLIGIPQFGGYEFTIHVWEDKDKLCGWVDEWTGEFLNKNEVYENMGEWDFYDTLQATSKPRKVVKPRKTNGYKLAKGEKENLSKEQYVHKKIIGAGGNVYYYGNGITVDMTYYTGKRGGSFHEALNMCRKICGNE